MTFEPLEKRSLLSATLTVTPNPAVYGQPVTEIASLPGGDTGTVDFKVDGTVVKTATVQAVVGDALHFDGSSGYIGLGQTLAFDNTTAFSVSFWIESTSTDLEMIVGKSAGFTNHSAPGWSVFTAYGYLYFQLNAGSEFHSSELQAWDLERSIYDNGWQHVVVTYDGSEHASGIAFYIDGTARPGDRQQ